MKAHVRDPPTPLSARVPGKTFWPALDATIAKALAKSPDDRYASAADFGEALRCCLPESSPAAPAATPEEPAPGRVSSQHDVRDATERTEVPSEPGTLRVPHSKLPSLLIGLLIGASVATAGYFALLWLR
jgi:hypothetical protein